VPCRHPQVRAAAGGTASRASPATWAAGAAAPSKLRPSAAAFEAGKGAAAVAAAVAAAAVAAAGGGAVEDESCKLQQELVAGPAVCDAAKRLKGLEGPAAAGRLLFK